MTSPYHLSWEILPFSLFISTLEHKTKQTVHREKTMSIPVHCVCRLPEYDNRRMIQCVKCATWYHEECKVIKAKAWAAEDYPWKYINRSTWIHLFCWVLMHCFSVNIMNVNNWIDINFILDHYVIKGTDTIWCCDMMRGYSDTWYSSPAHARVTRRTLLLRFKAKLKVRRLKEFDPYHAFTNLDDCHV